MPFFAKLLSLSLSEKHKEKEKKRYHLKNKILFNEMKKARKYSRLEVMGRKYFSDYMRKYRLTH